MYGLNERELHSEHICTNIANISSLDLGKSGARGICERSGDAVTAEALGIIRLDIFICIYPKYMRIIIHRMFDIVNVYHGHTDERAKR